MPRPVLYPSSFFTVCGACLLVVAGLGAAQADPDPVFSRAFDDLAPVAVQVISDPGDGQSQEVSLRDLTGVRPARAPALVLDFAAREVRDGVGAVLRHMSHGLSTPLLRQLQAVVDKCRILNALEDHAARDGLRLVSSYGDTVYFPGPPGYISVEGRQSAHVTILAFGADGTLALLYPIYGALDHTQAGYADPETLPPDAHLGIAVEAFPPYGAVDILAVETPAPHPAIRRAVARYQGQMQVARFWTDLQSTPETAGIRIGITRIFTAESP